MNRIARSLSLLAAASLTVGAVASFSGTQAALPGLSSQTAGATTIAADEFSVDAVHSSVVFRIQHQGLSYVYGSFSNPEGTFNIDVENPENTMLDVSVKTANVDTGNDSRDEHLRSPDFFNANQFPTLSFKSTSAKAHSDGTIHVTGELRYHGRTQTITIPVTKLGEKDTQRGYKQGFVTEFTIKRADFGDNTYIDNGVLSNEVDIIVSLQGVRG